jgi:DNA-binding SARP family transcriptional activator
MARLEYRILGPLEVRSDGRALDLGPAKQRALLAILLVNAGRSVSTDRLIEGLWPDKAPGRPDTAVQTYVSNVRKVLEPGHVRNRAFEVLVTDTTGYVLSIDSGDLDARRFEHLTEEGTSALARGQADAAARKLRAALSLWRGNALEDFVYEPWAQSEASRLAELRLVALEHRIEADLACGRHGAVADELAALVAEPAPRAPARPARAVPNGQTGRRARRLSIGPTDVPG